MRRPSGIDRLVRSSLSRSPALGGRLPLVSLIYVLAVAEHLSFRHAATTLGVSQGSVSARVKTLEDDLGILLFERNTKGVRLTEAGRHFVEQIAAGIDQIDHAVKTVGAFTRGEQGHLRVSTYALIPHSFLAGLIARYRNDHPGVNVEISESTARDALMQLRTDRIDVAFVAGATDPPDCHSRQMWTEPLFVVLPANHSLSEHNAVTWADLADETFLVRYGGIGPQAHDHIVLRLARYRPAPSILRFDVGRCSLLEMVAQGFGVTIVGASVALQPIPGVTFLPIADEAEPVAFSAVWSPFNHAAALRDLLDLAGQMSRTSRAD